MITQMKKYTFLVLSSAYEQFLTDIREAGVVDITLRQEGMAEDAKLQDSIRHAEELRHLIAQGAPDQLLQERNELEQKILNTRREAVRMQVWGDFSSDVLRQLREAGYQLRYYTCPESKYTEDMGIEITREGGLVYFVTVNQVLASEVCTEQTISDKSATAIQADVEALEGLMVAQQTRIEAWKMANMERLQAELHEAEQAIDWQRVTLSSDNMAEGSLKLVQGFCPINETEALDRVLEQQQCYYEKSDPVPDDQTPIKLHNNRFTRLFECLTGMYGWPNYGEFDPTPILGPFFLLFFALCIGDAGYGLMLVLAGYLIMKDKLKIAMFEGMGPIIMALGVGSTVIGYMMGGFFGIDIYAATWMPEGAKALMFKGLFGEAVAGYDIMMVLALVIGVIHLCLAMTIKCICSTKRFGFKETISTWGWLVLILGAIITLILGSLVGWGPVVTRNILIAIGAVSALGIFIFNTPGRNPLINIGAGLWDTYGMVTGLLGDVLSYIRLYALGLAGGMLGAAFNQLGEMVLGEVPNAGTWVGFILIVTFGHVLNLLMACLGAFVHPLRLSFVEYFKNSGYEGNGKLYRPFSK